MTLPQPPRSTRFADCMWLDRIISKLRLKAAGALPPEYVYAIGAKTGVDGTFLRHFGLELADIERLAKLDDAEVSSAFLNLPGVTKEAVAKWNEIAVNLGRDGYPMAGIVPRALAGPYSSVKGDGLETVFDVLEADEGLRQ